MAFRLVVNAPRRIADRLAYPTHDAWLQGLKYEVSLE